VTSDTHATAGVGDIHSQRPSFCVCPWLGDPGSVNALRSVHASWLLPDDGSAATLHRAIKHFSSFPYENVTKILKSEGLSCNDDPRRLPNEVLHDHLAHGFGGTCFSLTAFMESSLTLLGFRPQRFLADMNAGPAMHSALLVPLEGRLWLVDPGYLLAQPMPVPDSPGLAIDRDGMRLVREDRQQCALYTVRPDGVPLFRYRFSLTPVDEPHFTARWLDSFQWSTNRSLLITCRQEGGMVYLHDRHLRITRDGLVEKINVGQHLGAQARQVFGMPAELVEKAHTIACRRRMEATQHESPRSAP